MNRELPSNKHVSNAKERSRNSGTDMTAAAISRRLDVVDELRELERALRNAKRLGKLNSNGEPISDKNDLLEG